MSARASRIRAEAERLREFIGGSEEDALKVEFATEHETEFNEWLMARLESQAAADCYEQETLNVHAA